MKKKRRPLALPAPASGMRLLASMPPSQVGMFRRLLEGYDGLANFTVLDKEEALLKISFSPHQERELRRALEEIAESVPFSVRPWPTASRTGGGDAPSPEEGGVGSDGSRR